ncbi:hypothetical protein D3C77_325690 [compost metagenome]
MDVVGSEEIIEHTFQKSTPFLRLIVHAEEGEQAILDVVDLIALSCSPLLCFTVSRLRLVTFSFSLLLHAGERIFLVHRFTDTCHQPLCFEAIVFPAGLEILKFDDPADHPATWA